MDDRSSQNMKFTPSFIHLLPFSSTTKHLGKIRLHMVFTFVLIIQKKLFAKTKLNKSKTILRKCQFFFILTASTRIKIRKAKFEVGCSYRVCNQFIL